MRVVAHAGRQLCALDSIRACCRVSWASVVRANLRAPGSVVGDKAPVVRAVAHAARQPCTPGLPYRGQLYRDPKIPCPDRDSPPPWPNCVTTSNPIAIQEPPTAYGPCRDTEDRVMTHSQKALSLPRIPYRDPKCPARTNSYRDTTLTVTTRTQKSLSRQRILYRDRKPKMGSSPLWPFCTSSFPFFFF